MEFSRRDLFKIGGKILVLASAGATLEQIMGAAPQPEAYRRADHWWGMIIDIDKCIGCGSCVRACSKENHVPAGYFRTWVERYQVEEGKQPIVDSPNGAMEGFPVPTREGLKSFFVPKLCNHCADSPCVQVCPVGATFVSPDGVVLVDTTYCLGCRYCIQACPYGCRTCIRKNMWWISARSATTVLPRVSPPRAARTVPPGRANWWISRTPKTPFTSSCAITRSRY